MPSFGSAEEVPFTTMGRRAVESDIPSESVAVAVTVWTPTERFDFEKKFPGICNRWTL